VIKDAIPIEHLCLKCNISNFEIKIIHPKKKTNSLQLKKKNNRKKKKKKKKLTKMNLIAKKMKHHLAKLKVAKSHGKTYTCKNTYLQRKQQNNQQMVKT